MEVFAPIAETGVAGGGLAQRLHSLLRSRIAIVDNRGPNSTVLLHRLAQRLQADHGVAEVTWGGNFASVQGRCDALIDGIGH